MKRLYRAQPKMSPERRESIIRNSVEVFKVTRAEAELSLEGELKQEIWKNDVYQVNKRLAQPGVIWLSIKRIDKTPCRSWRDFQDIKNQLVGPENETIEIFPAESRLIDTSNQYHVWVFSDPEYRLPFGFHNGRTVLEQKHEPL